MNDLLSLLPKDELFYAVLGVFLPAIVGVLVYVKAQKDEFLGKLGQAKIHVANSLDFVEDIAEGLIEALGPDSPGGISLTDEEKAESWEMAQKALSELKKAKGAILGE
jgi:hypothetical protein